MVDKTLIVIAEAMAMRPRGLGGTAHGQPVRVGDAGGPKGKSSDSSIESNKLLLSLIIIYPKTIFDLLIFCFRGKQGKC